MDGPRADDPDLPLRQVGPYQLLGIVGAGRTGTVFRARRAGIDRDLALKLLPPGLDAEEEGRVLREARVASRLVHPGFARVLEVERHHDRLYVVMEHVPGPTLREQVERGGPMAADEAAELVAQLADALEVAHRAGVVHRDVSARNVVLDDRTGRPRLVDFGLASDRGASQQLTRAGQALGSPEAAAPEQLRGEPVDARADVYSLGVLLYELLTATRPFEGGPAPDVARRVLSTRPEDRPAPPSRVVAGVDRRVEAACLRAMAPRPEDRFPSAAALADALRGASAAPAGPADARPATWLEGRAAAALTGALAVAVAGALVVAAAGARREATAHAAALDRARARLAAAQAAASAADAELASLEQAAARAEARRGELERALGEALAAGRRDRRRAQTEALRRAEPDARAARAIDALAAWLEPLEGAAALRAELLIGRGRGAQALEAARRARDVGLELRCLVRLDRGDELRARLGQALRDEPEGSPGRLVARLLSGDAAALQGLGADAPVPLLVSLSEALTREGLRRGEAGPLEQAVQAAEAAVRREPTCVEALYARSSAVYHLWLTTRDAALIPRYMRDLYRARALSPQAAFWIYAGKSFVMNDRPVEAVAELQVALAVADQARDPTSGAMARAWLGAGMLLGGEQDDALDLWLDALRLAPDSPSTYDFLPWAGRLSPERRRRLLAGVPASRRDEVERAIAQGR